MCQQEYQADNPVVSPSVENPTTDIEAIESEYRRLDEKWLSMQYQASLWIVLFAATLEVVMFFVLEGLGEVETTVPRYLFKYFILPFSANLILLLVSRGAMRSRRCSENARIYVVSISVALCCFVVYTVHCIFPALYLIFTIPMLLTVIYADRKLTTVIAVLCIAEKVVSDLFLVWDVSRVNVFSSQMDTIDFIFSVVILASFYCICLFLIQFELAKNNVSIEMEKERMRLRRVALTDPLTGVGNRQALRQAFNEMEGLPHRRYMLAMIDIDNFKNLNDTQGHACGDSYLTAFGEVLREECGADATPFRFGGDEFCVLLEGTVPNDTKEFCLRLQDHYLDRQKKLEGPGDITLSIGVADYRFGEHPFELLQRADAALYRAKEQRDRVCFASYE